MVSEVDRLARPDNLDESKRMHVKLEVTTIILSFFSFFFLKNYTKILSVFIWRIMLDLGRLSTAD